MRAELNAVEATAKAAAAQAARVAQQQPAYAQVELSRDEVRRQMGWGLIAATECPR